MPPTPPIPQLVTPELSNTEYSEFCRHCARQRLAVPSRETTLAIKRKFVGSFLGHPAWLQLCAFPGQQSARLWLILEREQCLMEIERQAFTPPKLGPRAEARAQISLDRRQRILRGQL